MDEYLRILLEQIRCRKVHPYIQQEIKNHIEDQIEDNLLEGMSPEEAEKQAVKDMGDPVEVGVSFDRIHRPKLSWGVIVFVAILSIAGIIIHMMISHDSAAYEAGYATLNNSIGYIKNILIGLVVMIIIYLLDYTTIAKYSRIIATVFLSGILLMTLRRRGFGIGFIASNLMMLYVPLYAAVLYKHKGKGITGIIQSLIWMIIPVMLVLRLHNLAYSMIIYVALALILIWAITKGWYDVNRKAASLITGLILLLGPVVPLITAYLNNGFTEYQLARINAFIQGKDEMYISYRLKELHEAAGLFGNEMKNIYEILPDYNTDYIYTYITNVYGVFAAVVVCAVFIGMTLLIIGQLMKQKNQLGQGMGLGAILVLVLVTIMNILGNLSIVPLFQTFLPFLSGGTTTALVSYSLAGIIISVYKYKNIYPKHVDINSNLKLAIKIENK